MKHKLNKPKRIMLLALVIVLLLSLVLVAVVAAQTGGGFDLEWNVIGAGGGRTIATSFQLDCTTGQTAASIANGSGQTAFQGFWNGVLGVVNLFLPITMKH